ncbi:MAG: hypothetical protein Kow0031_37860 [Anaerolineae bacterium]
MTTDLVQTNYEQVEAIARRFAQQAEAVEQVQAALRGALEPLQQGGWEGQGAQAFFTEMDSHTLPAVDRLRAALSEAGRVALKINEIMRQAEEEAAAPFRGPGEGGGSGGESGSADAPAGGGNGAAPSSRSLLAKDPARIFNEGYMEKFIGSRFQGANSAELNRLMEALVAARTSRSPEVDRILDRIADIRGVDRAEFRAQYQTYLQLLENAHATGGDYPDIDLKQHGNFLGTTVSLRYGAVVGDAFGIDPVFGSLLNPTGGLVGPGSMSYQPGDNDAVGYHGIFHDAAGYLYNYHEVGPGYNYMGREPFDTGNPLTGQLGGISWWMSHPQLDAHIPANQMPDIPIIPRFVEVGLGEVADELVPAVRVLSATAEGGGSIVDGVQDIFAGDITEGAGDIAEGVGTIVTGVGRSVLDFFF